MLEHFIKRLAIMRKVIETYNHELNKYTIKGWFELQGINIKEVFGMLRGLVCKGEFIMTKKEANLLVSQYNGKDATWGRTIKSCAGLLFFEKEHDPSSEPTITLKKSLTEGEDEPNKCAERVMRCLDYIEREENHQRGFCVYILKNFIGPKLLTTTKDLEVNSANLTLDEPDKDEVQGEEPPVAAASTGGVDSFDEEVNARALDSEARRPETEGKASHSQEDNGGSDVPLSLPRAATPAMKL